MLRVGDPTPLAADIRSQREQLSDLMNDITGLNHNIAINYGGRDELVRAVRRIAENLRDRALSVAAMDENPISQLARRS